MRRRDFRYAQLWTCDWRRVLRGTWCEVQLDDCFGAAAQLAFYFLLAFIPFMVFLAALATLFAAMPASDLEATALAWLGRVMPPATLDLVRSNVTEVVGALQSRNLRLLLLSMTLALWTSAGGMRAVIVTLNRAYNVPEGRKLWWRQLLSLGLTVALALSTLVVMVGLSMSAAIGDRIRAVFGAGPADLWEFAVRSVLFALLVLVMETIYHFAPNARRPWRWLTPGSLLAVLLWLAATWAFGEYVSSFGRYEALYAGLGAPIVLLLWFYITGLSLLLGAEVNAEIEREIGIMPRVAVPAPPDTDAAGHHHPPTPDTPSPVR